MSENPHRRGGNQKDFYRPRPNKNNAFRNRGNRGNYSRSRDWNRPPESFHNRFNNNQRSKYYNRSRFRNNHSWINQNSNYSPTHSQVNDLRSALAQSILQNFTRNENEVYDVQNDSSSEAHPSITDTVRSVLGEQDFLTNRLIQSLIQNEEGNVVDAGLPAIDNASSYENSNNLESLIATTIVQNIYGNARNHENEGHVDENFANTSVCKIESSVDAASQELNNASDSAEHETSETESTPQTKSGISLVPLSFLIAPRSENTDVENDDISEKESDHSEDTVSLQSSPTVRDSFKKPEQISKKLVNQVVTMDKTNIRHVINNPVSKFDVALKMHAKKRLREEIRKQLRNINFETTKMNESNILQPDEYIETANIPVEMLDKFKTVFGYHFSRDNDEADELNDRLDLSTNEPVDHREETTQSDLRQSESKSPAKDGSPPKIDLMTKLKNLESIKLQASLKKSKQLEDDDVYIIENPKVSVTILHDDSSSDSATTTTTTTTTTCASPMPNVKLQQKFLDSFKKIVLPNMTAKERRDYEKKMENGQELANIYQMCIDKLNDKNCHIPKPNLYNFSDNSSDEALNFLVQNIHDLFKQQKCDNKPTTVSKPSDKRNEVTPSKPTRSNYRNAKRKAKSGKDDDRSRKVDKKSDEASNRKGWKYRAKSKSKTTNSELEKSAAKDNKNKSDSNEKVHSSTEQSTSKDNKTKSTEQKNDKCSTSSNGRTKDCEAKDQANSATYIELDSPVKSSQVADSCNINLSNERLWRSPGEKKCLQLTSEATSTTSTTPEKEKNSSNSTVQDSSPKADLAASYLELKNYIGENYINPSEVFQITSLVEQNKLSTTVLNNLKEIDSKLMDLNKQKMDIEKNIIQLQKEKMEIDLAAMQYQSDRFALISSALSNPTSYLSPNLSLQKHPNHTESTINEFYTINNFAGKIENNCKASSRGGKRKHVPSPVKKTTNFSEKLKNRKKRCQRDILIEDAANTLFSKDDKRCEEIRMTKPSELSDKINDIFTIRTKRNQNATTSLAKEKNIAKSNTSTSTAIQAPEENLLPVSCVGNSVNIIDCDISDSEEEPENRQFVRSVTNGALKGFRLPIVQIIAVEGYIICASEDGNIYKFDSNTRQLISTFSKHTESITEMYVDGNSYVYSTSLDGYMKKTTVENFGLELQSINLHEPLQAINLSWNQAFIGSRWGNIFTYDTKRNKLNETLLCSVGSAITALKATKEGPRKILIISSKGEKIHFRDASSGLLLRTVSVPVNQNIYSILLNGGLLYCGSSANQVYTYDFTTGNLVNAFLCGNGAVSIKLYKNKLLFIGCYDGFIYVLEKNSGQQIGRFPGSGKMILALEIIGEKLLTSAKDNSMEIIDIPKYILALIK